MLLWAGGVITGEVEVIEGSTCSGYDLLELLLLVPEVILFLVVILAIVVSLDVVVLVRGVDLLLLGVVGDEVSGVVALEAAPRWSPPLLTELVQDTKLPCQQGDLVVGDALILLIRSYDQRRQDKLQSRWDSSIGGVSIITINMSTSNQTLTSKRSIIIWMTLPRQFIRFKLAK
jgi:hypothetical protein